MKKRNAALNLILCFFTCGIWTYVWIYEILNDLQYHLPDEDINAAKEIIFTLLTCGLYGIYLYYKMGKLVYEASERKEGNLKDNSILYLILSILGFGLINYIIIQTDLNKLLD